MDAAPIAAGEFGAWLRQMQSVFRGERAADVPCGDCVGCCVSSYFIHVRQEDGAARARIPPRHLVPAPGLPAGTMLLGFAADGSCPMLAATRCSIYAERPRTCRDYDCRIFAAAGIDAGGPDKSTINARVRAWVFSYASDADARAHRAVRAAASFIRANASHFPGGRVPTNESELAVLAIKVHAVFLRREVETASPASVAAAIVEASRAS
jgi:hypothetical protein